MPDNWKSATNRAASVPPGVLAPPPADAWKLQRLEPCQQLAPYVAWFWAVEWDLRGHGPHLQATLPHPSVQLVVDHGATVLFGPVSRRFTRELTGVGQVYGARFQAAGFWPFVRSPIANLADHVGPVDNVLSNMTPDAERMGQASDASEAMAVLERAVLRCLRCQPEVEPRQCDAVDGLNAIVELIATTPTLSSVEDLAATVGRGVRSLQRDFARYVGLAPKAIIRRYRLQEAASVALNERDVDWSALAERLGYYDQAHLISDFTATIGSPPAAYARDHLARDHPGNHLLG